MKGALDGGLDIPHSEKRFAGFKKDDKRLDAEVHRNYIFGGHVTSYMKVRILFLFFFPVIEAYLQHFIVFCVVH